MSGVFEAMKELASYTPIGHVVEGAEEAYEVGNCVDGTGEGQMDHCIKAGLGLIPGPIGSAVRVAAEPNEIDSERVGPPSATPQMIEEQHQKELQISRNTNCHAGLTAGDLTDAECAQQKEAYVNGAVSGTPSPWQNPFLPPQSTNQ